ncbi:hypothetical protein H7F15_10870 [Pontibacter sp. Tf4]|uniref:hypothetical protein n=1 Tax=Pontibacter sp. Tf4 TaxID=2761620 RepID=UPI0016283C9B|nr:hypothetical protein [Pontibacter sp. Tf4]MBB6611539.1 hypothetical protein [Pontibacter sp. Tf4]
MESVKTNLEDVIIHLSEEERQEPVTVILELFSMSTIDYWRIDLWQYLKAATTKLGWPMMRQPGDAVSLQKMLEKLMESCWLILLKKEASDGEVELPVFTPYSKEWWEEERQKRQEHRTNQKIYGGNIRLLRNRELDNPCLVLKAFFETMPLARWKNLLSDWTEYALRRTSMLEETENYDLLVHYEQLVKLLEVAWILNFRYLGKANIITDGEKQEAEADTTTTTTTALPSTIPLSLTLQKDIISFLQEVPPERLSDNLLRIYMGYLKYKGRDSPDDDDSTLHDFLKLYNLLRSAELDAKGIFEEIKRLEQEQAKN